MRIIFITSKLNFTRSGGSIEEIDFILKTLQQQGHTVTAVTTFSHHNDLPTDMPYAVIPESITVSGRLPLIAWDGFRLLRKYQAQADWFIVDAHLFMYGAGLYRRLGGRVPVAGFFNQFLTCWPQYVSSYFPAPKISIVTRLKRFLRWCLEHWLGMALANRLDLLAFVSPTLRGMYEKFGLRATPDKIIIVGDPIDWKKIMRENGITPDSYGQRLNRGAPVTFFYSSRMSPGKGFDLALLGLARVKNKAGIRLILGGTGPEEPQIKKLAHDLHLEPYVKFLDWVAKEQLYQYYKTADVFIQADWWPAGTSISLLYALAFGLPSVLPGGGGLQWNAGESALYFKYRDPDDLARAIERLAGNPELRLQLSRNCFVRLAEPDMNYEQNIARLSVLMQPKHPS